VTANNTKSLPKETRLNRTLGKGKFRPILSRRNVAEVWEDGGTVYRRLDECKSREEKTTRVEIIKEEKEPPGILRSDVNRFQYQNTGGGGGKEKGHYREPLDRSSGKGCNN